MRICAAFLLAFILGFARTATAVEALALKPQCIYEAGTLLVFVNLKIDYAITYPGDKEARHSQENHLLKIECNVPRNECHALVLQADGTPDPLSFLDVTIAKGMSIVTKTRRTLTLEWGEWRTFSVDLAAKKVFYRESGPTTEGRGVGNCQ